jgi:hypothetical protein
MTYSIDDDTDESPEETRESLLHDIKTKGVRAAYNSLLSVCQDPKAPAPARATAGVALLRAGGFLLASADATKEKEPHEMTAEELAAEIRKLSRKERELRRDSQADIAPTRDTDLFD